MVDNQNKVMMRELYQKDLLIQEKTGIIEENRQIILELENLNLHNEYALEKIEKTKLYNNIIKLNLKRFEQKIRRARKSLFNFIKKNRFLPQNRSFN